MKAMEKTYTTQELVAFSREWTLMREKVNDICRHIEDEGRSDRLSFTFDTLSLQRA